MNRSWLIALIAPVLLVAAAMPGMAADTPADMPGEAEAEVLVQKGALDALEDMKTALRDLGQFSLVATTTMDDILDHGQLVQIAGTTTVDAKMPDRLRVTVANDKQERLFVYDGKTVTQYAPALDIYSNFEAPGTIAEMIVAAEKRYGVQLPLGDLFFWAAGNAAPIDIEIAYFAGETSILGQTCAHYAYRVPSADVQLWIGTDGAHLPCRMVIVNTSDPTRPQYSATLAWDTDVVLGEGMFGFAPPPGVRQIEQKPVVGAQ